MPFQNNHNSTIQTQTQLPPLNAHTKQGELHFHRHIL